MKYYLDENGELWKKDGADDFYFSRKSLEWIKSAIVFIAGSFEYNNEIETEAAEKILADYKAEGKWGNEELPIRYFSNDNDIPFAIDVLGNEYYVTKNGLKEADKGTVDCMWGGITEESAIALAKINC